MKKSSRSSSRVTFTSEKPEKNTKAVFFVVLLIAMFLSAGYLYLKNGGIGNNTDQASQQQNQAVDTVSQDASAVPQTILEKVKKHIVVTEEDIPYIATITNIDLVKDKNPDFYANASDGDKVVVWKDRAIIYSESKDRIVAVATAKPLLIANEAENAEMAEATEVIASASQSIEQQIASSTIEIRNGSRKNGAARTLKQILETSGLRIDKVGDAGSVYEGTQIIDLTDGKVPAVLDLILKATSGTVATVLPETEKVSNAQILILIGR
jgi:hypothetical protein